MLDLFKKVGGETVPKRLIRCVKDLLRREAGIRLNRLRRRLSSAYELVEFVELLEEPAVYCIGLVGQHAAEPPETYPEPVDHCALCDWKQGCADRRRADDHLSLVAGITRPARRFRR